jgi:adenylate kinase
MDKGELVPDEIVIGMVEEVVSNLDSTPFILDGFPRTSLQAEELDILLKKLGKKVDLALFVDVPNEKIVERLSGRRICSSCGTAYHIKFKPPKNESVCDLCGSDLYQRKDDNVESINTRLDVYSEQTLPLREYYKTKSVFSAVNGDQDENAVFAQIKERL